MEVEVKKIKTDIGTDIIFNFKLNKDQGDVTESVSFNAGNSKIKLKSTKASFSFPFDLALPHNDLIALAALKIISPYVGRKITFNHPVSHDFATYVKAEYPKIQEINSSDIPPRTALNREKYAVSFSGGADSVAAANISPDGTPLILLARKLHPEIGKYESWYRTDGNLETLKSMQDRFVKIPVLSDFEYLSVNMDDKFCVYPDAYAFTIPCILLADHLGLTGILTGDMAAAFTNSERNGYFDQRYNKRRMLYRAVGLDLQSAIKGITEIGTEIINNYYGNGENSNTCQYGGFRKPCMKCIKCFRKSLIRSFLKGEKLTDEQLKAFDNSPAIKNFVSQERMPFPLTFKLVTQGYNWSSYPNLNKIMEKVRDIPVRKQLLSYSMDPYKEEIIPETIQFCLKNIKRIFKDKIEFDIKDAFYKQ